MKLNQIKFKNFVFDYNPSELEIEYRRSFSEQKIPFYGSILQDIGAQKRIIKGSGCFFGSNCTEKFLSFSKLINSNTSGALILPNLEPIDAFLRSVTVKSIPVPDRLDYTFIFWENPGMESENEIVPVKKYHIVVKGETLWTIAEKYSISASELLKLNPDIKRPDELIEGQKVVISL